MGVTFARSGRESPSTGANCAATTVRGNRLPASFNLTPVEEFKRSLEIARIAALTPLDITALATALPTHVTSVTATGASPATATAPATTAQLPAAQPPVVAATPVVTHTTGDDGEVCSTLALPSSSEVPLPSMTPLEVQIAEMTQRHQQEAEALTTSHSRP